MVDPLLKLWGKTSRTNPDPEVFHPALFHMLDVGNVARELLSIKTTPRYRRVMAEILGADSNSLLDWLPWLIAMHDIGKVSAAFQQSSAEQWKRLVRDGFTFGDRQWDNRPYHAITSAVFVDEKVDGLELSDYLRQGWRDALGGHHGEFSGKESRREAGYLLRSEPLDWGKFRRETSTVLQNLLLDHAPDPWPLPGNLSATVMALNGFTVLCDWIGSDEKFFSSSSNETLEDYVTKSAFRAKNAVEAAGFLQPAMSIAPTAFSRLFFDLTESRPLQLAIDAIDDNILSEPCLAIIEAPTGEGKTEAALALAHRLGRRSGNDELYYALPTTATSNQMYTRLCMHIEKRLRLSNQVKLVHGQAFLLDDDFLITPLQNGRAGNAAPDWFGSDKRKSLLVPFGVGTIDQAELAALNVRFTSLRLIGLAGKVVILDEVHAYDTYMTTIIERLLNWLAALGTSVILLSATLPCSRREALIEAYGVKKSKSNENKKMYPHLFIASRAGVYIASPEVIQPGRKIAINRLHLDDDAPEMKARWLLDSIVQGGCVCWITNTVERAQKIFHYVDCLASPDVKHTLIHSRFPLEDRQKLENDLANYGPNGERPVRGIVIGTQVLEQSLDLDFDVMVSDLAPIDLLLQRAGRLYRHSHHYRPAAHDIPRLWINIPQANDGSLSIRVDALIYNEFILLKTLLALNCGDEIHLPFDYRPLVETVYDNNEPPVNDPLRQAWEGLRKKQENARSEATLRILPEPDNESSFCGQLARLIFEESENKASWIIAQTRMGDESITIIPLECEGNMARLWPDHDRVPIDIEASRQMQKKLMRRSIRTSNYLLIAALKSKKSQHPNLFTKSSLLKECYPIWLVDGVTQIPIEKGILSITLHPQLGLIIEKIKEANA